MSIFGKSNSPPYDKGGGRKLCVQETMKYFPKSIERLSELCIFHSITENLLEPYKFFPTRKKKECSNNFFYLQYLNISVISNEFFDVIIRARQSCEFYFKVLFKLQSILFYCKWKIFIMQH